MDGSKKIWVFVLVVIAAMTMMVEASSSDQERKQQPEEAASWRSSRQKRCELLKTSNDIANLRKYLPCTTSMKMYLWSAVQNLPGIDPF